MKDSLFLSIILGFLTFGSLSPVAAAPLTSASATLGNSRLSYQAGLDGAPKAGDTVIKIQNASAQPDKDTRNLFPNDLVCFFDSVKGGCRNNRYYKVGRVVDNQTFTILSPLETDLAETDLIVVVQKGRLTVSFTTQSDVPKDGYLTLTIPAKDGTTKTNDGFPDVSGTSQSNGFDMNGITQKDVTITGCITSDWDAALVTPGDGFDDHVLRFNRKNTACPSSSTITIAIDDSPGIVNPAPLFGNIYPMVVRTKDASGNTIDTVDVKIEPVGGVLVSATVGRYRFSLWGYTSPSAIVTLDGIGISDRTTSDKNGYFSFTNSFAPLSPRETCLTAQDQFGRLSNQVCLPPFPIANSTSIGPVLMPPTVSLSRNQYFIGDEVILSGQTMPDTTVEISVFIDEKSSILSKLIPQAYAFTFPKVQAKADKKGNFSLSLPSSKTNFFRLFAQTIYQRRDSPKSITLSLKIFPWWMILIELLKSRVLEIFIALLIIALLIYLLTKRFHPHELAKNRALVLYENHPLLVAEHELVLKKG